MRKGKEKKKIVTVNVKDLPPAYQTQILRKLVELERCKKTSCVPSPAGQTGKQAKYHNQPTERVTARGTVLRFDSQKETRRFDELSALERAGKIRDLRLQVDFTLQEAYTDTDGHRVRAIRYRADFTYREPVFVDGEQLWKIVVEDVKSAATRTKTYAMKKKMMQEQFAICIREV